MPTIHQLVKQGRRKVEKKTTCSRFALDLQC